MIGDSKVTIRSISEYSQEITSEDDIVEIEEPYQEITKKKSIRK